MELCPVPVYYRQDIGRGHIRSSGEGISSQREQQARRDQVHQKRLREPRKLQTCVPRNSYTKVAHKNAE